MDKSIFRIELNTNKFSKIEKDLKINKSNLLKLSKSKILLKYAKNNKGNKISYQLCSMKTQIVVLVNQLLNPTNYKRFNVGFKDKKIDLIFWSLTPLLNKKIFEEYNSKN